uniref:Uncharacterized protein n=1 Tax=Panagrolaimus sp. JU765 TaxID=591449 RepID=A0AC34R9X6_9BILA
MKLKKTFKSVFTENNHCQNILDKISKIKIKMTEDKEELIKEEHINDLESKITSENDLLWKEEALSYMDLFYQNYGGHQWHEFSKDSSNDQELMITDICYALFGSPTIENENK